MKCPGCGRESRNLLEACERCGAPMMATAAAPGPQPVDPADDLLGLRFEPERSAPGQWLPGHRRRRAAPGRRSEGGGEFVGMLDDAIMVGEEDLDAPVAAAPGSVADDCGPPFSIDDDLFAGLGAALSEASSPASGSADGAGHGGSYPACGADLPGPAFALSAGPPGEQACGEPIIDRDDEIPERCWAPEVAGLGTRALAVLVDQSLLLLVLGAFYFGALAAFRLGGIDTGLFLGASGLRASALPFGLLAALLSLCYFGFFHATAGCTPGKALVGVEVRAGDGGKLSGSRILLRWLGAFLGLTCAGVGIFWAMFEPRRRGWADLLSGTVVARPRRGPAPASTRR